MSRRIKLKKVKRRWLIMIPVNNAIQGPLLGTNQRRGYKQKRCRQQTYLQTVISKNILLSRLGIRTMMLSRARQKRKEM
ncbi:hypothetical protein L6452_14626 [Arctium lappa]|uniref:Uncharacterized protein n=1 Tax=Arctium lappa TaxID=4217 RepID=A0ACB9CLV2_ARCLA|nr:hypothetical protein L6452_14626 [Arctium lappa]